MPTDIFLAAVRAGDTDAVAAQLSADPALIQARSPEGVSAILTALYHGKRSVADLLVERGSKKDIFDAAALGDSDRLAALLASDPALASAWSADGFQAIHLAAFFGHPAALSALLEAGAPPDQQARHSFGVRPLHSACACGNSDKAREMAKALIVAGADVNARQGGSETGFTPLMAAAQDGDPVLARLLLDAGAETSAREQNGKTARDFAREGGHADVEALLPAI